MSTEHSGPVKILIQNYLRRGSFIDDGSAGVLHAAFVRSPFARAKITKVDTEKALSIMGLGGLYM